ncbi:Centrosomal protein of 41 kDa [Phytophthora boehmeriae]|uniref:Centrosomal protein of 41 kDa n=1 Tax=Phytophthora boehmeriae TaxID=109152 RepID=A0A8T1V6K4_9STRA|nr:Centrosomal protein of 41 kDa [Phytophthora boehmeriae]
MSKLLPRVLLNRFFVLLLVCNCWSSLLIYSGLFRHDEARKRFSYIALDCMMDVISSMGVQIIIISSYVNDYIPSLKGFDFTIWYNDEWVARALNEFQMLVVVSWADLASRTIFSIGLMLTTTNMKELLQYGARNEGLVTRFRPTSKNAVVDYDPIHTSSSTSSKPQVLRRLHSKKRGDDKKRLRGRFRRWMDPLAHVLFGLWGVVLLIVHIYASAQPTLPQCLMQVRPWATTQPSCYLLGLDCYTLDIAGKKEEVSKKWSEFDSSTVVQLVIRHCPELEVPDLFSDFHKLRVIKVYNSTIQEWSESAAITSTNHPAMASMLIVRVNMTDGLLPAGFQSPDFPQTIFDIEICITNIRELPEDLDTKWAPYALIQFEYCQLTTVQPVLWRLQPYYLALTGNPITEIPAEVFEAPSILYIGIGEMNIYELPWNVTQLSPQLSWIYISKTYISFFWPWVDELVERMNGQVPSWFAGASTYCTDLEKIENGSADTFSVPMSPEYSTILMDPSEANRQRILDAVICDVAVEGLFYPLTFEDGLNAISIAPPVLRP